MKNSMKRLMAAALVLAMILSFVPVLAPRAKAWTANQQRIADRCDYFYNTTWVCQKTIYGWRDQYVFYEGETYRLPYAQPVNSGEFIGYGVTLEEFERTAADRNSVYYSRQSEYNGWTSTYYGTDCAAFVAMCWGVVRQDCTTLWNYFTNLGSASLSNIYSTLQLGDALDSVSAGHVVLVSDMIYDDNGNLITIEITEQTPPQLKRTYFTPEELAAKYSAEYYIFRHYGAVPEAPVRGYISDCTTYSAHCEITITADDIIMSLPCTENVDAESAYVGEVLSGESYTAICLIKNTEGELWYQILTDKGEEAYIRANCARYVDDILTDITLEDAVAPSSHVRGTTYGVNGNISSVYNRLNTAVTYIYEGFGTDSNPVTGDSDSVTGNAYTLKNSNIDYATSFGDLNTGKHTYYIGVNYVNYYVDDNGSIQSNSGTIDLMEAYFMVVPYSTNQNSCSHNYEQTVLESASCTNPGTVIYACASCGHVYTAVDDASGHSYGDWSVITAASCESDGLKSHTCFACGKVEEEVIPATGHHHTAQEIPGDCQNYATTKYTCDVCGDVYYVFAEELYSEWSNVAPEGVDANLIQTKQQYRYSDLEMITSAEPSMDGYELMGTDWVENDTSGTVTYVKSWPAGFDKSHSLYAQYNNSPVKAGTTDTTKTVIDSDKVTGYLYFHWCYEDSYYTTPEKTGNYNIFHAFYSTVDPATHDRYDPSDSSYMFENECCSNSSWFFVTEVNTQTYSEYDMVYNHGKWGEFSDWSDEAVEATDTRMVETQILYRYISGELGEHDWVDGVCTVCGAVSDDPTEPTEPEATDPSDPTEPEVTDPTDPSEPENAPVLTGRTFSLSFEDEILVNFYFSAQNVDSDELGMLVFYADPGAADIALADDIYENAAYNDATGLYSCTTAGIAAKEMGDNRYYAAYAKLSDGSYAYSALYEYSPKKYALSRLANSTDANMKALCVAMLNYGAAAQNYFGYKTDDLMNASLTDEQRSMVVAYDRALFAGATPVDSSKVGNFAKTDIGFGGRSATVSFEGAFAINYYFVPNAPVDGDITFCYWDADAYAGAETLMPSNASGKMIMTASGDGSYWAEVTGIAAKQLDDTYYVAAFYTSDFEVCCTGVIPYSLSKYCMNNAVDGNSMQELAAYTAVYGYHAKTYFG